MLEKLHLVQFRCKHNFSQQFGDAPISLLAWLNWLVILKKLNLTLTGTWYVLIYLSRYFDQETTKWPFRPSSQAATCYYQSNHSKVEASR